MICRRDGIGEGGVGIGRGVEGRIFGRVPQAVSSRRGGWVKKTTCTSSFSALFERRGVGGSKEKYSHIFPFPRVSGKVGWGVKPSHFRVQRMHTYT